MAPTYDTGDRVPDFSVRDADDQIRTLDELIDGRRLVLLFYRGYW